MASLDTVKLRKSGLTAYVLRWREGGVARKRRVGTDRRMAEQARLEVEQIEHAGLETSTDGRALVTRFMDAMRLAGLRPATLAYYGQRLRWWLDRHGAVQPARWTRALLEQTLAGETGWSPRSKAMLVAALRRLRRWARKAGVLLPDMTDGLELPKYRPADRTPLTVGEVDALMAAAEGHHYASAIALACYAGLSLGDVLTLTWGEVDLDAGWIVRRRGRQKTGVTLRVPIVGGLGPALRAVRPLRPPGDALVCARLPKTRRSLYRTLQGLFGKAGIVRPPGSAWHLLRHSFGTLLMRAGVPAVVIGRLLSHRPGSTVTALYQHPDDGDLVAAMEALQRHMAEARGKVGG